MITKKLNFSLLILVLFIYQVQAKDFLPPKVPTISKYRVLWENSLFGKEQQMAQQIPIVQSNDTFLVGIFEQNGNQHAMIINNRTKVSEELTLGKTNKKGTKLLRIEDNNDPMKRRVQIQKRGKITWVSYNIIDKGVTGSFTKNRFGNSKSFSRNSRSNRFISRQRNNMRNFPTNSSSRKTRSNSNRREMPLPLPPLPPRFPNK